MADDTLFDKILRKEIPSEAVYEDDHIYAFADINPQAPVHVLVIPKTHFATLNDIDDDALLGRMMRTATKVAGDLKVADGGYRLVINTNKNGGQLVYHVHLHLIAGRELAPKIG